MPTGEMGDRRSGPLALGRFMDSPLNRLIVWSAAALVITVAGFGFYYYIDQSRSVNLTQADREMAAVEQAVRDDPADITARLVLADHYLVRQRFNDAAIQYEAALRLNEGSPLARVGLGRALLGAADLQGAAVNFLAVIEIAEREDISGKLVQTAYYYLGTIALQEENPSAAVEHLTQAAVLERSDADSWHLLGVAQLQAGRPAEAIEALSRAVLLVPNFGEAYTSLAQAFESAGNPAGALYARGMAAYSSGDLGAAAARLQESIQSSPALAEAHAGLGLVWEIQGDRDAAIIAYQQALHLEPENFLAAGGLARLIGGSATAGLGDNHPAVDTDGGKENTP
jgi:tetratricopeptide (TPR) repeat protein